MKIWTNNKFEGHYPVGTGAVVIAGDRADAKTYLDTFLAVMGLPPCDEDDFIEIELKNGLVRILCDGDY